MIMLSLSLRIGGRSGAIGYTLSVEHPFDYLVRAIVYQQLATAEAATIHEATNPRPATQRMTFGLT